MTEQCNSHHQDFVRTPSGENEIEVVNGVFAPGNLVHGTWRTVFELSNFFTKGIRRGREIDHLMYTPDIICFSLLGNEDLPDRYLNSAHFGPRWQNEYYSADDIKVGFIVSKERLLATYPGQLFAIGHSFWDKSFWNRIQYGRILKNQEVYGIPLKHPGRETVFDDEVRLYPSKDPHSSPDLVVAPQMILGMVALPSFASFVLEQTRGIPMQPIPVFSPQCELLAYAGRD